MPATSLPRIPLNADIQQVIIAINQALDELDWLLGGMIDSKNVRNLAGFNVDLLTFLHVSGLVGLSGADKDNPSAVRIWAGLADKNTAPFRVTQDGSGFASNFTIEGGVIRTNPPGHARIELSGGVLKGYNDSDQLHGLVFNPSNGSFFDLFFYHAGTKYAEFYDDGLFLKLRPTVSNGMGIGGPAGPIRMLNQWDATGCTGVTGTIPGNCATANYATTAGTANTAASADMATAIQPTGIANGTYTKLTVGTDGRAYAGTTLSASDIPSLDWSKITSGKPTTLSGYGITDAASSTQPGWTAPTLLSGWVNYGAPWAVAGYKKNTVGTVILKGFIKGGTTTSGTIIFTLPAGYRPLEKQNFVVGCFDGASYQFAQVDVDSSGNVRIEYAPGNGFLSLSGISFPAEQ